MTDIEIISKHLREFKNVEILTNSSLSVNGKCIQEAMPKYLANKDFYSTGTVAEAMKSPLHITYAMDPASKEYRDVKGTPASYEIGTLLHSCLLEPSKFKKIICEPKANKAKTDDINMLIKFWSEKIIEENEDNPVEGYAQGLIDSVASEIDAAFGDKSHGRDGRRAMLDTLIEASGLYAVKEEHYIIAKQVELNYKAYAGGSLIRLIKGSKREISMYGIEPITGIPMKIRPDSLQFEENIGLNAVISVKSMTNRDGSKNIIHQFKAQSRSLKYIMKEAAYRHMASSITGRNFSATIVLLLEMSPPFSVAALVYDEGMKEKGWVDFQFAVTTFAESVDKRSREGYEVLAEEGNFGLIEFSQPDWYISGELPFMNIGETIVIEEEPVDYSEDEDLAPDYNES